MNAPIVVRVPASTANLGAGFDALGMALDVHAEVALAGVVDLQRARLADEHHPATVAFHALGGKGQLCVAAPIPMGRGMGYSGAVRVAGAALAIVQRSVSSSTDDRRGNATEFLDRAGAAIEAERPEIMDVCRRLEGHGDNVAASLYGGVVATTGSCVVRVPLALDPAVVVWVPDHITSTNASRAVLPDVVPFDDAVRNIANAATFVAALAAGDVDALRAATGDALHQRQRLELTPSSAAALEAGLDAGAWCGWLSGSGPSVAFLCPPSDAADLAASLPGDGHVKQLRIDHVGATVNGV